MKSIKTKSIYENMVEEYNINNRIYWYYLTNQEFSYIGIDYANKKEIGILKRMNMS